MDYPHILLQLDNEEQNPLVPSNSTIPSYKKKAS